MVYKLCLAFLSIFAIATEVNNKPATRTGVQYCYKERCPENTYACERTAKISEDKKKIVGEIRCLGLRGEVLKRTSTSEDNPFSPTTFFQGYSYSGAYTVLVDSRNTDENTENTEIENSIEESDKNTGNGEVEDLNTY